MKIDVKTAIPIATILFIAAGFYYTTEARLDTIENEISFLNGQVRSLKADNKRLNKMIIRNKNTKKGRKSL